MQGEGDGDCAAGESGGSEGGAERSGKVNFRLLLRCSSQPSQRPTLLISCTEQLNSSVCPPSLTDYWYLRCQCPHPHRMRRNLSSKKNR